MFALLGLKPREAYKKDEVEERLDSTINAYMSQVGEEKVVF